MIKTISCNNKNYITKIEFFLEKRRKEEKFNTKFVSNIINDVKKK